MRNAKLKKVFLGILVLPLLAGAGMINFVWKLKHGEPAPPSYF